MRREDDNNGSGDARFAIRNNTMRNYASRGLLPFAAGDTTLMCADIGGAGVENSLGAAGPRGQADTTPLARDRKQPKPIARTRVMSGYVPTFSLRGARSG